jgi:hypothetical protein
VERGRFGRYLIIRVISVIALTRNVGAAIL